VLYSSGDPFPRVIVKFDKRLAARWNGDKERPYLLSPGAAGLHANGLRGAMEIHRPNFGYVCYQYWLFHIMGCPVNRRARVVGLRSGGSIVWKREVRNYRKRSRLIECAGVERKVKTRGMERKRECVANKAKRATDGTNPSMRRGEIKDYSQA
jgi:hypothetical protein